MSFVYSPWASPWAYWVAMFLAFLTWEIFHVYLSSRPKKEVNWELVYAIEREIWGHTFYHADAPEPR